MSGAVPDLSSLAGKEIVVGVGGGIAAYKVCDLVSKLVQADVGVTVAMTEAAQKFITPLTFEAL
ncbi:MAG: flavoprotein, partial [Planctomycetota bacterium]